jgi:hypothetical protein
MASNPLPAASQGESSFFVLNIECMELHFTLVKFFSGSKMRLHRSRPWEVIN